MQQTETYKLNLIETSDPFSPNPLNENARKTDAAITAETQARAAADAALDQRVTVLEGHKVRMIAGTYVGDGEVARTIETGVTPKFLILNRDGGKSPWIMVENPYLTSGVKSIEFVEGGFRVYTAQYDTFNYTTVNVKDSKYRFIAFA